MSLFKVSLLDIVKKQYAYKLRAYSQFFMSLIFIQLLAVLFSFNGSGMMGGGSNTLQVDVKFYSSDIVVIFTMLWALISAIQITTQANRNDDFTFVTNRLSSNLSNLLFLLTASMVGGITSILSGYLIRTHIYLFGKAEYFTSSLDFSELLIGFYATSLYMLLFAALGYFCGTLVQLHKVFIILLPGLFIGLLILGSGSANGQLLANLFNFIFTESSVLLFSFKILIISSLLFLSSILLSNDLEVKS